MTERIVIMDYKKLIKKLQENEHLISMTPIERIVEIGYSAGMNSGSAVLDLCCGYGEMLKIWHEAFDIRGIGVDICNEFIEVGKNRIAEDAVSDITLIEADIFKWQTDEKFDYVCLSGEDFGGFQSTIELLEKYAKSNGKLIIGMRYSKVENPPKELIEFEGETLTLIEINRIIRSKDYYITSMATDTQAEWERYIMWSAKRHLNDLRKAPENQSFREWCDKWYDMYFNYRRPYEGYVTVVIEKL